MRAAGIPVDIVSCGGGGTYLTSATIPGVTEVQAGGVTMGDGFYRDLGSPVEPALFLITTVVSRPTPDRIIVDAGRRSIDPSQKAPDVPELDGVTSVKFSAEHGTIQLDHNSDTPQGGGPHQDPRQLHGPGRPPARNPLRRPRRQGRLPHGQCRRGGRSSSGSEGETRSRAQGEPAYGP